MSRTVCRESFQFMIKLCSLPIVCVYVCVGKESLTYISTIIRIHFYTFSYFQLPLTRSIVMKNG